MIPCSLAPLSLPAAGAGNIGRKGGDIADLERAAKGAARFFSQLRQLVA